MKNFENKKFYFIDWINSLEISDDAIFVTNIEDLYNGKVILDILNLLNEGKIKIFENLNLLENIKNNMKIIYDYDFNIKINNENDFKNEILNLLEFLKNKYDINYKLINNNINLKNKIINFNNKDTKSYSYNYSHNNNINKDLSDYKIDKNKNIIYQLIIIIL